MKKSICIAGFAFTIMSASTNCLAIDEEGETSDVPTMNEVVVTATRTEGSSGQIGGSSLTVINQEEIKAKRQNTVEEVLKGVPGLDVVANGGPGTSTSVFLRGADSKNTLILVDGVMFNDPSSATRSANLANLNIDNIERIEVVRGPLSVLYGSNASAGVINIISKKGTGKPTVFAGIEGGSFSTWKASTGSSGSIKNLNYSITASHTETDGFSTANKDNDRIPHEGNTSENDGWKNTTLAGNFDVKITPDFDISAIVRYLDSEVELDDLGEGYLGDRFNYSTWPPSPEPNKLKEKRSESEQIIGKFSLHNFFFDRKLESNIYYQASQHQRDGYDNDGISDFDFDGFSEEMGWQGGFKLKDSNHFNFGISYFNEEMDSDSSTIKNNSSDILSYWLQDQIFIGDALDIVIGARIDDHDRFGSEATYRIAPAYTINQTKTVIKGSIGTGFRAPSLFELYSDYGNENLQAEKSKGWDIGIEQDISDNLFKLGATYFVLNFEDRIDYDFSQNAYDQMIGDTKTNGVETFIQWLPTTDLHFLLNYTYTDTEDPDGLRLVRRPLNKASLNTRYYFLQKGLLNIDINWVDERDANPNAKDKYGDYVYILDDYIVVNLALSYKMTDHVKLYGRIDNLFDEKYEEAWSYATPGLSGYAGLKVTY